MRDPGTVTFGVFLSYVQSDNKNDKERITKWFREELRAKVNLRLNEDVEFFKDTEDIGWGENWQRRIKESVESVKIFMPVITTRYFGREWCRQELEWFLEHEQSLGRDDLILPIYFLKCDDFERLTQEGDEIALSIVSHQVEDLTKRRAKMMNGARAREQELERLAQRLVEMLKKIEAAEGAEGEAVVAERDGDGSVGGKASAAEAAADHAEKKPVDEVGREREEAAATASLTVGPGGDYATLAEAVKDAPDGSEIVLKPGEHEGGVIIDRPLHVRGEGKRDSVVASEKGPTITCGSPTASIANLTVRVSGSEGERAAIEITAGRPEVDDCLIESQFGSGIAVTGTSDPVIRRNLIRGGGRSGIEVNDEARGTYEENEITGSTAAGLAMLTSKSPVVRSNLIHHCQDAGVFLRAAGDEPGEPLIEDNDIAENELAGVFIGGGAHPIVRRNRIHDGQDAGIVVTEASGGTYEDNVIQSNAVAGVAIDASAEPLLRRNRISDGGDVGVYVHDEGKGTIEDNDISGNEAGGIWIATGSDPNVRRNHVHHHPESASGVIVRDGGLGTIESNDLAENTGAGIWIVAGGTPVVRENRIHDGGHAGVYVGEEASGQIEGNEIFGNVGAGVLIDLGGNPTVQGNQIHDGQDVGVLVREGATGTVESNVISGNAVGGIWVDNAAATVTLNEVHDNQGPGLAVANNGSGTFEGNAVYGNAGPGVSILTGADPAIVRNRIYGGAAAGVFVLDGGRGTIEENQIFSNGSDGIAIQTEGAPVVRSNTIYDGADTGIYVTQAGAGQIEGNDIFGNSRAGVWIQDGGNPVLVSNKVHDHAQDGIVVMQGGQGTIQGNQVFLNQGVGVLVGADCTPLVQDNWIYRNSVGISVLDGLATEIAGNVLQENLSGPVSTSDPGVYQYLLQQNTAT
jgi:parallel beta-helix repeat protein